MNLSSAGQNRRHLSEFNDDNCPIFAQYSGYRCVSDTIKLILYGCILL